MDKRIGKSLIRTMGATADGCIEVAGVFSERETSGTPLDVLLEWLRAHGYVPCWRSFYAEARAAGMKHSRVLSMLGEAIADTYGPKVRDAVAASLNQMEHSAR